MSLRVWGRPSAAPSNLLTQKYKFKATKKCENWILHLASPALCELSFPLCLGFFDLVFFVVPDSPLYFGSALTIESKKPPRCPGSKPSKWRQRSGFSPFSQKLQNRFSLEKVHDVKDFQLFKKLQNRFSRKSSRCQGWVYSKNGHLAPAVVRGYQLMMQSKGCRVKHLRDNYITLKA